ncbi:hypothetical protein L227DRAFT_648032 [Lentinus tigrinus ALCF2SS1-6]|uniref:Uncharacterized protein n=1 Tax=Lentinus tigrinus ALCF2SS1-6 TaxID=1328759 RepID=A0A5C2SSJ2_9APHY|nr:hypothetical protein L227DRAFT_648032 [Lentinus tigrinus ALCF2SS1-6]
MSSSIKPPRGKAAPGPARPLDASSAAGSRAKPAISSVKASTASSTTSRTSVQTKSTRSKVPDAATVKASQSRARVEPATRVRATTTVKGTHLGAGKSTSSSAPLSSAPKTRPQAPDALSSSETPDALQLAAQSCAWAYMTSGMEEELRRSDNAAQAALKARRKELAAEEADIADSRTRYEGERMLDFYDELSDHKYNAVLDQLGGLEDECQNLEVEVLSLCSMVSSQDGRLSGVLHNLLDIVRGHAENVANAQKLVRCCKENYRVGIGTLTLV